MGWAAVGCSQGAPGWGAGGYPQRRCRRGSPAPLPRPGARAAVLPAAAPCPAWQQALLGCRRHWAPVHPVPGTTFPANNEPSQLPPPAGGGRLQLPVLGAAGTPGDALRVLGPWPEPRDGCGGWARSTCPLFALALPPPPPRSVRQMLGKGPRRFHSPSLATLQAQQTGQVAPWHPEWPQPPPAHPGPYKYPLAPAGEGTGATRRERARWTAAPKRR